ncbi:ATP-binding protein [Streptomyces sp. 7R007]
MEATCTDDSGTARDTGHTRATAVFDTDAGCIAQARRLAAAFLGRLPAVGGPRPSARAVEVTQLVVSELVTNARKYAPGPVTMELRIVAELLEVAVRDRAARLPVVQAADPERPNRHGLEIVTALVQSYEVQREPEGKRVTVRIALRDDR